MNFYEFEMGDLVPLDGKKRTISSYCFSYFKRNTSLKPID